MGFFLWGYLKPKLYSSTPYLRNENSFICHLCKNFAYDIYWSITEQEERPPEMCNSMLKIGSLETRSSTLWAGGDRWHKGPLAGTI
ncbi:hypothetical protein Trydic_g23827 [Trypoxylus dichotomus]